MYYIHNSISLPPPPPSKFSNGYIIYNFSFEADKKGVIEYY